MIGQGIKNPRKALWHCPSQAIYNTIAGLGVTVTTFKRNPYCIKQYFTPDVLWESEMG